MDSSGQRVRAFKSVLTFKIDDVMQGLAYYDVLYEVFTTKKIQDKIAALETAGLGSTQQAKRAAMAKTKELSSFAKQLKDLKIISKMPSKGSGFTDTILKRKNLAAKIVGYFLKTKLLYNFIKILRTTCIQHFKKIIVIYFLQNIVQLHLITNFLI